jgi:hypothetical protein
MWRPGQRLRRVIHLLHLRGLDGHLDDVQLTTPNGTLPTRHDRIQRHVNPSILLGHPVYSALVPAVFNNRPETGLQKRRI